MLLCNKSDLAGPDTLNRIIETFDFVDLQQTAKLTRINIFNISAKTGDQFDDAFDWLAETVTDVLKSSNKKPTKEKVVQSKEDAAQKLFLAKKNLNKF